MRQVINHLKASRATYDKWIEDDKWYIDVLNGRDDYAKAATITDRMNERIAYVAELDDAINTLEGIRA